MNEIPSKYNVLQHPLVWQYQIWWYQEVALQQDRVRELLLPEKEIKRRLGLIDLKIDHIIDCFHAAHDIASRMGGNNQSHVIGAILAYAHDIARPEQGGQKGHYSDRITGYNHALEGTTKLMRLEGHREREFDIDPYAILEAVLVHSDKDYTGNNFAAQFARDMDKLALLRDHERLVTHAEENTPLRHEPPTSHVIEIFNRGEVIPSSKVETIGDLLLLYCAWRDAVHFEETAAIIDEEALVPTILSSYSYTQGFQLENKQLVVR